MKKRYLERIGSTLMVFLFSFIVFEGLSFADTDEARLAYEFKTLVNHCNYQPANNSAYCTSELYKALEVSPV